MLQQSVRKQVVSPVTSLIGGYGCIGCLFVYLYNQDYYTDSTIFTWGVPTTFMGKSIENIYTYYTVLSLLFVHQLFNNWVSSVVYPWIINNVQNKDCNTLEYSNTTSVIIIITFDIYSELNMILLISGMSSQIGFFVSLLLADIVSSLFINIQYLRLKCENRTLTAEPSSEPFI